jgi:hypothetical protein
METAHEHPKTRTQGVGRISRPAVPALDDLIYAL